MIATVTGTGNGTAPVVNITFPFLDKSHVKVEVNGIPAAFTWSSSSQITFAATVAAGSTWRVYRETPTTPALVDFTDGAVLTEADLDKANSAHRYRDEELADLMDTDSTLRVPEGESMDVLPTATEREGTVLGFNIANGLRELLSYSGLAALISPFLSANLKGDPGSPGEGYATRAAMAARAAPALLDDVYLSEKGREGKFLVDDASLWTAQIAADGRQGMFVTSTADPTKVYVRKYDGSINARWFGLVGDGVTDDSAAILAAIDVAGSLAVANYGYAGGGQGSPSVYIPRGVYWMGTTTIDLIRTIELYGESVGEAGGAATVLKWADATTGIRVQMGNTTGATGVQTDPGYSGAASIIRNLTLYGGYAGTESESHGIHLRARASIRDVFVQYFPGDGIHIEASSGAGTTAPYEGNANSWEVSRAILNQCRDGLYVNGSDVNAGASFQVDALGNRGWGINDNSFLGNTHVAPHTQSNGSGPYQTTNANATTLFLGAYSEGDQPAANISAPTLLLQGAQAAGVSGTGTWAHVDAGGLVVSNRVWTPRVLVGTWATGPTAMTFPSGADNYFRSYGDPNGGSWATLHVGGLTTIIEASGVAVATAKSGALNIANGSVLQVGGTQVVGTQQAAIADDASAAANQATVNAILAALRTHGLIAT